MKKITSTLALLFVAYAALAQQPVAKMMADPTNSARVIVYLEWPANAAATSVDLSNTCQLGIFYSEPAGSPTVSSVNGSWTETVVYTQSTITGAVSNPDSLRYVDMRIGAGIVNLGSATAAGTADTLFKLTFPNLLTGRVVRMLEATNGVGVAGLDNTVTSGGSVPTVTYRPNSSTSFTDPDISQSSSTLPLPVELLYLTADWQGEDAVVEWETASELNNSHFDVERSFDGSGFEYIGTVGSKATGGNSNQRLVYTYTDLGAKARTMKNVFYRLIQTDFDGASEVFGPALLRVNRTTETSIALFPVPAQNQVTVQTIGLDEGVNYTLRVIGNLGNTVQESTFLSGRSYNKTILDISSLPSGVYRVTVEGGNLQGEVEKFIKID